MISVDLIPLPDAEQVKIAKWSQQTEAMQLLGAARGKRAHSVSLAAAAALIDPVSLIASKAQLSPDAVHNLAQAARISIFLEVWEELTHGEPLKTARVSVA